MLMSAIDSTGWKTEKEEQKTYSLLAVLPLPPPLISMLQGAVARITPSLLLDSGPLCGQ